MKKKQLKISLMSCITLLPRSSSPELNLVRPLQDLKAACDWLKTNDISGVAYDGNPLDKLANIIPTVDPELVQKRLYGKSYS